MLLTPSTQRVLSRALLDVLIRASLIAVLAIVCFRIFVPFLNLMVWALILAITLYPLQIRLRRSMPGRDGLIATLIVFGAFVIVIVPTYLLGVAVAESIDNAMAVFKSGRVHVPPPDESVLNWPFVGKRVYDIWLQASTDIAGLAQKYAPQFRDAGRALLGTVTGLGMGMLVFFAALIVSGILMAYGEKGHESAVQIASRISGPDNGVQITDLCTATIRAVAQGVVGIAFIQMLLIGVGFIVKGIPGAGLLALAVLMIGIMQLPATLITVPVIIFVFVTEGVSTAAIVFSGYVFVAGLVDNVLKPLLLGRGVAVPMPVVLIGALGGMVSGGVIGLFIGPVMLAVGYQLFWRWVRDQPQFRTQDAGEDQAPDLSPITVQTPAQTPTPCASQTRPPQAPDQQP
ncbi:MULTISPECIES: AI-2E family transporter [Paraburkholderia]|uniref:PurR-regulated permease PerM n=1 Tax=Paraburkholderia tropica TaxID=92647 RepID=A0AAQ1GFQ9_9BURK|nr:AI-2E family transporter [Paraburkholderia tropica]MBB2979763.1 putative PurR-regulated permease PerM [Paraburkholderia tropica]MBB3000638.1 putative PurR-regulated permease PerM [Paraburkholderia tropica]MBB6320267.1 putative PurR-regulated permease PerM [Paraburkholderia tropica]MDE1143759.1 AI-2E family transporter [Paraburkholderia tropica]PXX16974.1 putative PurR-regulated permease PerM [Paraburkholderia tropica]